MPDDFRTPRGMPDALDCQRREPETTVLYRVVQQNLETFLACAGEQGRGVPRFVEREVTRITATIARRVERQSE